MSITNLRSEVMMAQAGLFSCMYIKYKNSTFTSTLVLMLSSQTISHFGGLPTMIYEVCHLTSPTEWEHIVWLVVNNI